MNGSPTVARSTESVSEERTRGSRALVAACSAHAVHDGLTDMVYVLLPLWQAQFAINYAQIGLLRGSYSGAMAGFQLLASRAAKRWGRERLLVAGTLLAGLAYLIAGQAGGMAALMCALILGGMGGSVQHPLASSLVADSCEADGKVKQALAQYNFSGDVGKTLIPAATGLMLVVVSWRISVSVMGALGLLAALLIWRIMPAPRPKTPAIASEANSDGATIATASDAQATPTDGQRNTWGMPALLATGTLDNAVRMGFLTFLPFLLVSKGAGSSGTGLALGLLFIGGAFGKLLCGYLGARIGMMKTVWITESATALMMLLAIWLPLTATMFMLPLLGLALNGTSSVLYGTVTDLAGSGNRRDHAFALFYTGTIGGGTLAPFLFGRVGDIAGIPTAIMALSALLLLTLPASWVVNRSMRAQGR